MSTSNSSHSSEDQPKLWPKKLEQLPTHSPLKEAFREYMKRMDVRPSLRAVAEGRSSPEIQETSDTMLHCLQLGENNQKPDSYEAPQRIRWAIRRDVQHMVLCQNETHKNPLRENDIVTLLRQRNVVCYALELQSSPESENVGHIIYDLRKKCLGLLSIGIYDSSRRKGATEYMLAKMLGTLVTSRRTHIKDGIEVVHNREYLEKDIPLVTELPLDKVRELLQELGFEQGKDVVRKSFHHPKTDATFFLPETGLQGMDVLTLQTQLDHRGLMNKGEFSNWAQKNRKG